MSVPSQTNSFLREDNRVTCDGQNRLGNIVSAVVCFYRLLTDGTMLTRKIAVVR